ncbi:uncharacterized protein NECHADRAFT_79715 [Fusarium vanettenii 77-13-4]|uniref:Uncharacterized protein n=1 Tax=Fusarium vanettenii (strain ATCC MYA-4622 / CBS 123669 / FGSC 9596 / NRRL 45880 / 77-13-4) TaxID=660122 RepID=C7Z8A0_FUSV7|nr:uncharacterized protein NECHADRAFT_79715 [Fusarium vanettenii 77-13-4]EEU39833.1 hypothetical protein NECHADRAFT_79715 [Fusarium vanettenii 77-13-4]
MAGLTFSHPLVLLVLLLAFSHFLEAADFSRNRQPKGDLKVRLDYALATNGGRNKRLKSETAHKWVFSTYLVFNEPVSSITSGQLKQIAFDAFDEMAEDIMQYDPENEARTGRPRRLPGVMTIMAFDNEIILASSQKGSVAFLSRYPDNPVSQTLDLCQTAWRDQVLSQEPENEQKATQDHFRQRKCGEVSTFFQYYQIHDKKIADLAPKARDVWGCNLLVKHANIDVDYFQNDVQEEPYDLDEIAGGIKKIGQIQMHPCNDNEKVLWSRQ